jgi:hypothetical protein
MLRVAQPTVCLYDIPEECHVSLELSGYCHHNSYRRKYGTNHGGECSANSN